MKSITKSPKNTKRGKVVKFNYDPCGPFWRRFRIIHVGYCQWFDLGIVSIDYYHSHRQLVFYFWKFSITFQLREKP